MLDIIPLLETIHSGEYLAQIFLSVTDLYNVSSAILSITRDNASANNVMISNIECSLNERQNLLQPNLQQPWAFKQEEGDIRCIAHIINIAVQSASKEIKAVPADNPEVYRQEEHQASINVIEKTLVMTALEKLRKHIYIFRNRRAWREALRSQLIAFKLDIKVLILDMPVR